MFALHETTQRRVCRIVFLVLCIVPTLLTVIGVAHCNRPWRQQDWQRTLAQRLHVRAALDDIARPRPGVTVLTNLHLADLRSNQPLAAIGELRFQRQNSRLTLHADHLEILSEQLPAVAAAVSTWLATGEAAPLEFHADQFTISSQKLPDVQLKGLSIRSDSTDPQNQRFRLMAYSADDNAIQVELESDGGLLRCLIDSQRTALPAWLIGQLVPGVKGCGEAEFFGVISVETEGQRVRGDLKGRFEDVNLQEWIGNVGLHRLRGSSQIQLVKFEWSDNGIDLVRGKIESPRGATSYSFLLAMRDLFSCVPGVGLESLKPATEEALIPFDRLALSFHMTDAGIVLTGECGNGGLMIGEAAPLLYGPRSNDAIPVAQFVRLFHRPLRGWLPDTRGAHEMSKELPLPRDKSVEPKAIHR